MKIIIGITQDTIKIKEFILRRYGKTGPFTEVGPFLSRVEALNWLAYLKSVIGSFEEIIPTHQEAEESIWYGFTFEKQEKR